MSNKEDKKIVSLNSAREKEKDETRNSKEVVVCSFCSRPNTQVLKMIQGPGVNICSECTLIAVQYLIIEDKIPSSEAQKVMNALWGGAKK